MSTALKALARLVAPEGESSAPLALQLQAVEAECVEAFGVAFKQHEMAGCVVLAVWTARQAVALRAAPPLGPQAATLACSCGETAVLPGTLVVLDNGSHATGGCYDAAGKAKPAAAEPARMQAPARDADLGQRAIAQLLKHEYSAGTVDGSSVCAECGAAKYARDAQGHTSDEPEPHKAGCEWGALVEFAKQGAAP